MLDTYLEPSMGHTFSKPHSGWAFVTDLVIISLSAAHHFAVGESQPLDTQVF